MTRNTRSRALILALVCGGWATLPEGRAGATGQEAGPVVLVTVLRAEREKSIGLDAQLAGLRTDSGRLLVSTSRTANAAADFEIRFSWRTSATIPPSNEVPARADAAENDPARQALRAAMADSYPAKAMGQVAAQATTNGTGPCWEVVFPPPRSGASLAHQFRVARRLVAARLAAMNMMKPLPGTWPPDFRPGRVLALYDAEGVGYYGSTLLARAVDETTLDAHTLAVCPGDIREGILDRCIGVLFPGGSGKGIAMALQRDGVQRVRDFVAQGGGYFGVCAGAYLAASGLPEYAGMMPLTHDQPWAKGHGTVKLGLTAAGAALLGEEFRLIETRYNCGPVFPDLAPNGQPAPVSVLARFESPSTDGKGVVRNEMVGTPAILSMPWQKGRILVISPHPESHSKFSPLVARAMGWTIGQDPQSVQARALTPREGLTMQSAAGAAADDTRRDLRVGTPP